MKKNKFLDLFIASVFIFCSFSVVSYGQPVPVGQWREHLPYSRCISVADAGNKIYCATPYALFYFDKSDNSLNRISRINGLNDIGLSVIDYHVATQTLVVCYSNANIDLIRNGKIINISDIKRKSILGKKSINNIMFFNDKAYLACGFGIVVLDVRKQEISDTYIIGPNGSQIEVFDLSTDNQTLYAATPNGLYFAPINEPNLANFAYWNNDISLSKPNVSYNLVQCFSGKLIVNQPGTSYHTDTMYVKKSGQWMLFPGANSAQRQSFRVMNNKLVLADDVNIKVYDTSLVLIRNDWTYNPGQPEPRDALLDKNNVLWIADASSGLIRSPQEWHYEKMILTGPYSANAYALASGPDCIWAVAGGKDPAWNNIWLRDGASSFINETWKSFNPREVQGMDTLFDFLSVTVDPANAQHAYVGSWGKGLLEFTNGSLVHVYHTQNSTLRNSISYPGWLGIGGTAFDADGNLWITNSANPFALHVKKANNTWKAYNLSPIIVEDVVGKLVIDHWNQKWIIMPRGHGIVVFNDNNTLDITADDRVKRLDTRIGNGQLPSGDVQCLAVDRDGEIWVGTDKGIAVFYSPENVFSNNNFDAQQILITQDGKTQYLLEFETVTAIAVDGANQKWIGTQKAGVFLMSEDGTKELGHFNTDNSPILSNTINDIAINHQTGEVFFATDKGIISYRAVATAGRETHDSVLVFPNPVPENYNGFITIKGLVTDVDIKITDVSGNIICHTKAQGGQAVWNGKNYQGDRARSGVYLVFASNADGTETVVAKILFVN